jgi:hypothetical protein
MEAKAIGLAGAVIAVIVGFSIFFVARSEPFDKTLACSHDSDCVPAGCCHSNSVINKNFVPDCSGVFCTAVCEPNTLDCGQARPKCVVGRCEVIAVNAQRR